MFFIRLFVIFFLGFLGLIHLTHIIYPYSLIWMKFDFLQNKQKGTDEFDQIGSMDMSNYVPWKFLSGFVRGIACVSRKWLGCNNKMITEINQSGLMIDLTFLVSFAMFIRLYAMVSSAPLISLDEQCFHSANVSSGVVWNPCFFGRVVSPCVAWQ